MKPPGSATRVRIPRPRGGRLTFAEESADHEAEGDGGDGKAQQEGQQQRGVTVREHRHALPHLRAPRHGHTRRLWRGGGAPDREDS